MNIKDVKAGKKYWYRRYNILADVHKIRVTKIFKLNDGRMIVRFRYNAPLFIYKDIFADEFIHNVCEEVSETML